MPKSVRFCVHKTRYYRIYLDKQTYSHNTGTVIITPSIVYVELRFEQALLSL